MDLRRSSRKPSSKGLPAKHPIGADLSKPQSDQESPHEACSSLSSRAGRFGNSILDWGRRRANGTRPTINPTDRRTKPTDGPTGRRTKPTDGPNSRRAKPTGGPTRTGGAGSRTHTISCHTTRSTRRRNMPSKFKDYVMNIEHSLRPVKWTLTLTEYWTLNSNIDRTSHDHRYYYYFYYFFFVLFLSKGEGCCTCSNMHMQLYASAHTHHNGTHYV